MSASQTMKSQRYCLLLIQSSTGKLSDSLLPVPKALDPVAFVKAILASYKLEVSKARRLYYRCVLGKKPAVSVVTLAKVFTLAFCRLSLNSEHLTRCRRILLTVTDHELQSQIRPQEQAGHQKLYRGPHHHFCLAGSQSTQQHRSRELLQRLQGIDCCGWPSNPSCGYYDSSRYG